MITRKLEHLPTSAEATLILRTFIHDLMCKEACKGISFFKPANFLLKVKKFLLF